MARERNKRVTPNEANLKDTIDELVTTLRMAINDVEEMGCTCIDRSKGHQRDCAGVMTARKYRAVLKKAKANQ